MKKTLPPLRGTLSHAVRSTRQPRWSFMFTAFLALTTGCGGVEAPESALESAPRFSPESAPESAMQKEALTSYPARCSDIKTAIPSATDGEYLLYYQNDRTRPWAAWCQDMNTIPLEYLSLSQSGATNYSQYNNGANNSVTTMYSHLRIDPTTLTVNTGDQRFTWSGLNGPVANGGTPVKSMPYASAMACVNDGTQGSASIDLRGTPFAVLPSQFAPGGYQDQGNDLYGNQNQTVTLKGSGYCGWESLSGSTAPFNQNGGALKLQYLDLPRPATCTDIRNNSYLATDGLYVLFVNHDVNKPWIAQCKNMQGAQPIHYISLAQGGLANSSQYNNGTNNSVTTTYSGLRVDPSTFIVDTSDQTFSWSSITGPVYNGITPVTSMPYASAMACVNDGTEGSASIDLRGTPFNILLTNQFTQGGYQAHGSSTPGNRNQTVTLKGGGYCGWESLSGSTAPFNQGGGSLQLNYAN